MSADLTMQLASARAIAPQGGAQAALVKQNHELETALASQQATPAVSPAPQGQGAQVDKQA